jgi:hypothetical protein
MKKHFYAAYNSYGTNLTFDSPGWSVHTFNSKAKRDAWVDADRYPNSNATREAITRKKAKKIRPQEDWIEEN